MDAESLALYAEGLLSDRERARIRSHLSGCPECAATADGLTAVSAALRRVPPAPLPAEVAARLDQALAAEVAQRAAGLAATPAPADGQAPATASPADSAVPAGASVPADPAVPAAGAAGGHAAEDRAAEDRAAGTTTPAPVAAGGETGARQRWADGTRPPRRPTPASRPGDGRPARGAGSRRSAWRSPAMLRVVSAVAGVVVALAGAGYALAQLTGSATSGASSSGSSASRAPSASASPSQSAGPMSGLATPRTLASGTDYTAARLGQQADDVLHGLRGGVMKPLGSAGPNVHPGASPPPVIPSTTHLLDCGAAAAKAAGPRWRPRLIDRARYEGKPALVVVLQPPSGTSQDKVVVLEPGCSAGHPDQIAEQPLASG